MQNTKIVTYTNYEHLFQYVEKGGILLPTKSYLKNSKNIDGVIKELIENLEQIESISYCTFLNAIVQTHEPEEIQNIGWNELKNCKIVKNDNGKGIVFHRDNLLYMIAQIMLKNKEGTEKVTGQKTFTNAIKYYKSLLLASSQISVAQRDIDAKQVLLKDLLLRSYPYYYLPNLIETIYRLRFPRYWYIYSSLINEIEQDNVDTVKEAISTITKEFGISLEDYFGVLTGIFNWFIIIPNFKRSHPSNKDFEELGFNPKRIGTFYIDKKNFDETTKLYKLIHKLARNLGQFEKKLTKKRKDQIKGFYENFQCFFDYPVFQISENHFCIIDFKFLFEGICSGFIWHLNGVISGKIQKTKEQYGYLLEAYFVELVKNIFGEINVTKPEKKSEPDAIVETDKCVLIFEFTVEYYRFASLYNGNTEMLLDDIYRLLFNEGKSDPKARDKKDKGKFHKLNQYIEKYKNGKRIIPILVTENNVGDIELLNQFDKQIDNNITGKKLGNLEKNTPLIINLDDLEIFWRMSNKKNAKEQFIDCILKWQTLKNKGPYHYNFTYFIRNAYNFENIENDSDDFFNWKKFTESLK